MQEGFKYWFEPDKTLATVWSAPNYCYRCGNVGSILAFNDELERKICIFNAVPESAKSIPPR